MNRKIIILRSVASNVAPVAAKFTRNTRSTMLDVTLPDEATDATLLLKCDTLCHYSVVGGKNIIPLEDFDPDNALCLVVSRNKPLYYGSSGHGAISCFSLLDEYCHLQKTDSDAPLPKETEPSDAEQKITLPDEQTETNSDKTDCGVLSNENVRPFSEPEAFDGQNFYQSIKPQLDEMFVCYPEDDEPADLIPNSKWIRVNTKNSFYVVGLVYDLDEVRYVCYGVSGTYKVKPPAEIADIVSWIPADLSQKFGDGFWMIFQDAATGKTVIK